MILATLHGTPVIISGIPLTLQRTPPCRSPWYVATSKPSTADMTARLRRVMIAFRFKATRPDQPSPAEMRARRVALKDASA
jgi:hypothetical protein